MSTIPKNLCQKFNFLLQYNINQILALKMSNLFPNVFPKIISINKNVKSISKRFMKDHFET